MNLIDTFQDLVAKVPELIQPLIVAAAGAVPFIEGEGAATIGVLGGIPPIVAAIAAVAGNFLCVLILVLISSRTRDAVVARRARSRQAALVAAGDSPLVADPAEVPVTSERGSARRAKFQRAFERYGVPGVSLLGPLILPTQFTATMLAASGVGRARVLFWQALAIVGWTTVLTLVVSGVLTVVR